MAKRILVPLDGTPAADAVLPLVGDLARGAGSVVRLLHVARIPDRVVAADGHVVAYADQEMARVETEAMNYLSSKQQELAELSPERAVRFADPVTGILEEAQAFGADLIALTSGHRRGLGRLLLGSTAEAVCRRTAVPVVVVHGASDAEA